MILDLKGGTEISRVDAAVCSEIVDKVSSFEVLGPRLFNEKTGEWICLPTPQNIHAERRIFGVLG